MLKKNLSILLVLFVTALLLFLVIWFFNKRIERLDQNMKGDKLPATKANKVNERSEHHIYYINT